MIKIALIEDDPQDVMLFKGMIKGLNNAKVTVFNKLSDLDGDFNVIITDLNLVGEAYGSEIIKAIRKKYPDTALIGLTGLSGNDLAVEYISQGLDGFVNKKDLDKVSEIIRVML